MEQNNSVLDKLERYRNYFISICLEYVGVLTLFDHSSIRYNGQGIYKTETLLQSQNLAKILLFSSFVSSELSAVLDT